MLYPQILGADFANLPQALRLFHSAPGGGSASGTVTVEHRNRWLAWLVGFPPRGKGIPLRLNVTASGDRELWTRQFGKAVRCSQQDREGDLLREVAGPLRLCFRLRADSASLRFECRRARFWFVPLPLRIQAEARGGDKSWEIEVTIPFIGSYRGDMVLH